MEFQVRLFWQRLRLDCSPLGGSLQNLKLQWPLGQLLGITHRTVLVNFSHFKQRFSPRKVIPINVKTLGDLLHLKRIEADLSQPELAVKSGATVRKVKAWEHDQNLPTEVEWKLLEKILKLETITRPTL